MQKSDTLAQIQSSINYVMDALTLPDYINEEDVEQQTALVHLELLQSGAIFESADALHREVLIKIRDWLSPVILNHESRVRWSDCRDQAAPSPENRDRARRECMELVEALPPRKKYIIEQRYGLNGEPASPEEIAREFGLSTTRIRSIERTRVGRSETLGLR